MRFSVVMATLTCLWAYTFWFFRIAGHNDSTLNPVFFGIIVVPFDFFLMYPGTKALGVHSDSDIVILLFVLEIIHGFGFYFIQKGIQKIFMTNHAIEVDVKTRASCDDVSSSTVCKPLAGPGQCMFFWVM